MLQLRYKSIDKRPLWLVNPKYTLGSDAACDVYIEDNRLESQHVELNISGDNAIASNLAGDNLVKVNGQALSEPTRLKHGDSLKIGSVTFELIDPKLLKSAQPKPQVSTVSKAWSLRALNTALAEKQFIVDGTVVIGRSNECDITLGVAHLSRKHAQLSLVRGELVVEDLQSSNGTFVNGTRVDRATLKPGDELSFDTLRFKVSGPAQQADQDPTKVRDFDSDKTSIRAAVQVSPEEEDKTPARPAAVQSQPMRRYRTPPPGQPTARVAATAVNPAVTETEQKSGSGFLLLAVTILAAVGAGVWFFLSQ